MVRVGHSDSKFIVDSGASEHIANDPDMFISLRDINPVKVHLADDTTVEACQEGIVNIHMCVEDEYGSRKSILQLRKVLFIPEAGVSMLSCAQLDKSGISTMIEDGRCVFVDRLDKGSILGYARKRASDGLYVVNGMTTPRHRRAVPAAISKDAQEEAGVDLWHRRLGHISKDTVRKMFDGVVDGMSLSDKPESIGCEPCVMSKQTKSPSTGTLVKDHVGPAIHSDIIGPMRPKSLGGGNYLLCFVVDTVRYGKVFVIKKRSEVREKLAEFLSWLEVQTDVRVKRFHSDGAKEFVALGKYLSEKGIVQTMSTPYTPQSNGLAERYNRTILDKVRTMLHASGLSMQFWGEAAIHAAFLTNVTVSSTTQGTTPYELVFKRKPDLTKIRVFGCAAFVHVPKENRSMKLSTRSKVGALVRNEDGMYRIWDFEQKCIIMSKHVKFAEGRFPAQERTRKLQVENDTEEEIDDDEVVLNLSASVVEPIREAVDNAEEVQEATLESREDTPVANETGSGNNPTREARYPWQVGFVPDRYCANAARRGVDDDTPTLRVALKSDEHKEWRKAIRAELEALERMGTWEIVERPSKAKVIFSKWVLKKKRTADGNLAKYKARLVICGNHDTDAAVTTFAPVVDFTVVRLLLAIAAQKKLACAPNGL